MKNKFIRGVLLGLMVLTLGVGTASTTGIHVLATEEAGETTGTDGSKETPEENTEETTEEAGTGDEERTVSEDNPEIKVFTTLTNNKLKVSISNGSEEDMKNTALLFDEDNRYSTLNNYKDLGTIKAGDSQDIEVTVVNVGHGVIKKFCDASGGAVYGLTFIGVSAAVVAIYIGINIYRKVKKKKGKVQTFLFTVSGVVIILACGIVIQNRPNYKVLTEGQNYARDIKETYNDTNLLLSLNYNQDIIEEKTTSKEEEIDFDVEYTYDENKPVTEDTEVISEGKKGKRIVTTTTVYRNGEVDDTIEDSYVLDKPVAQKEIQGTKKTIQIENIDAKRVYAPDDSMFLGESKLDTPVEEAEKNLGKKVINMTLNLSKKHAKQ